MNKIPCTVSILTHNSGTTLERALNSVKDFAEIIICDGKSTDNTLDNARAFGARILVQDTQYLDDTGHITDFAGVRNQCLDAATQEWFFFLDSDEYCGEDLAATIAATVAQNKAGAYFVNRRYVRGGVVIDCATTYPNRQMRFFARSAAERFIKKVHERIQVKEGFVPAVLTGSLYIPFDDTLESVRQKWDRYIAIEVSRHAPLTWRAVSDVTWSCGKVSMLYLLRLFRNAITCRGTRVPLKFELERHRYHARLVAAFLRAKLRP